MSHVIIRMLNLNVDELRLITEKRVLKGYKDMFRKKIEA